VGSYKQKYFVSANSVAGFKKWVGLYI